MNLIVGKSDPFGTVANSDEIVRKVGHLVETLDVMDGWGHSSCLGPENPERLFSIIAKVLDIKS